MRRSADREKNLNDRVTFAKREEPDACTGLKVSDCEAVICGRREAERGSA
jgi:hypothetical protein